LLLLGCHGDRKDEILLGWWWWQRVEINGHNDLWECSENGFLEEEKIPTESINKYITHKMT
jgi:hypothetical protein